MMAAQAVAFVHFDLIAEPDKHCKALQNWIRHRKDLRAKENKRGTTTQSTEF